MVSYNCDAWGKMISKTGTLATTLGTLQPFRYRGCIFDEETGLYYLRSRYYNPNLCRFINADDGEAYVDAITTKQFEEPVKVYNFEVEDFHTYFIARHSVLAHNMCKVPGKSGKQARLKELMNDDKLPRHIRGELKRDFNAIQRGTRRTIRVPQGYDLSHRIGQSARKGYSYAHSDLNMRAQHLQHHKVFGYK